MERLIVCETDKGNHAVRPSHWAGIWNAEGKIRECGLNHTAVFRHKEDADWYAETKNLEEQGKILRLLCKVGDTIYKIPSKVNYELNNMHYHPELNRVYEQVVYSVEIFSNDRYFIGTCDGIDGVVSEFYKETWFINKEEAEAALERMKGEEHE